MISGRACEEAERPLSCVVDNPSSTSCSQLQRLWQARAGMGRGHAARSSVRTDAIFASGRELIRLLGHWVRAVLEDLRGRADNDAEVDRSHDAQEEDERIH